MPHFSCYWGQGMGWTDPSADIHTLGLYAQLAVHEMLASTSSQHLNNRRISEVEAVSVNTGKGRLGEWPPLHTNREVS